VELKFIGDRSSILAFLELYKLLPPENCAQKMTKRRQKLLKIARKLHCFLYIFRIYSLKIFDWWIGGMAPSSPPLTTPLLVEADKIHPTTDL